MTDGPYSRVYHTVMDDPCFDGIREDMRLFGSWSMMLIVADQAYPAPAFVPPTVSRAALKRLVAAELVELLPGHRYRLRGQEKERSKRSESGRNAAAVRWQSGRNARRDETRKDEISPPPHEGRRKDGTNPRALGTNLRANGTSPRQEREAEKRGPVDIGSILRAAAAGKRAE